MKIFRTYDVATRQNKFFLLIVCSVVCVLLLSSVNHVSCSLELDSQTNEHVESHKLLEAREELDCNTTIEDVCCDGLPCSINEPVCCAPSSPTSRPRKIQMEGLAGIFVMPLVMMAIALFFILLFLSTVHFLFPNGVTFFVFVFRVLVYGLLLLIFGFELTSACVVIIFLCTQFPSFFYIDNSSNTQVDTPSTSE